MDSFRFRLEKDDTSAIVILADISDKFNHFLTFLQGQNRMDAKQKAVFYETKNTALVTTCTVVKRPTAPLS